MEEKIESRLWRFANRVVVLPIEDFIYDLHKRLSVRAKLFLAVTILIAGIAIWFRSYTVDYIVSAYFYVTLPEVNASPAQYLGKIESKQLGVTRRDLSMRLKESLDALRASESLNSRSLVNAWEVSQTIIGLGLDDNDPRLVAGIEEIRNQQVQESKLWAQFGPKSLLPAHLGATGWSILALSKYDKSPPSEAVRSVVSYQLTSGAWPHYGAKADSEVAFDFYMPSGSVYVTTINTWALHQFQQRTDISPEMQLITRSSLSRSKQWLCRHLSDGVIHAGDYPDANHPDGEFSPGLEGFVIFVLSRIDEESPPEESIFTEGTRRKVAARWVDKLKEFPGTPKGSSISSRWIYCGNGLYVADCTSNFHLPWSLGGTARLLPYMNRTDRVIARRKLQTMLQNCDSELPGQFRDMSWLAAEFLIASKPLDMVE